jgi:hypothetical protein
MSLTNRYSSFNEAVLISLGSTKNFPKKLQSWRAKASQQQIIWYNVCLQLAKSAVYITIKQAHNIQVLLQRSMAREYRNYSSQLMPA